MSPPFLSHPRPPEAPVANALARPAYLESTSLLIHVLCPAFNSKAENWTCNVFWPRCRCSDDHGPRVPSSGSCCQSGSATSQARQIGAGDQDESLRERLSHIYCATAPMASRTQWSPRSAKEAALVPANGQDGRGGRCFAVANVRVAVELRRAMLSENSRPYPADLMLRIVR